MSDDQRNKSEAGKSPLQEGALLPIVLNKMDEKLAVVVGGGPVGARKARGVLNAGGRVKVISPTVTESLSALIEAGTVGWEARPYTAGDLEGADLVFAATNVREVNRAVARQAKKLGILCNVADAPEEGDFHSAAVVRQDGFVIGVNNVRRDPKRAVQVKTAIEELLSG